MKFKILKHCSIKCVNSIMCIIFIIFSYDTYVIREFYDLQTEFNNVFGVDDLDNVDSYCKKIKVLNSLCSNYHTKQINYQL